MNLTMPDGSEAYQITVWKHLTSTLFQLLKSETAKRKPLNHLDHELTSWKDLIEGIIEYGDAEEKRLFSKGWDIARGMIWCAKQAVEPDPNLKEILRNRDQMKRLQFALKPEIPDFIKRYGGWAWSCIYSFSFPEGKWRTIKVDVALYDEAEADRSTLATLALEVLEPGSGQVFHHPEDILKSSYLQKDFKESLDDAWEAARNLIKKEKEKEKKKEEKETDVLCDGRWQLILPDPQNPPQKVGGSSPSGAAALGWYHALKGTKPDDGVIVLAEIDQEGNLSEVGGIEAKTKAIANARDEEGRHRFDTIVVASEKNLREAATALGVDLKTEPTENEFGGICRKILQNDHIRVVLPL